MSAPVPTLDEKVVAAVAHALCLRDLMHYRAHRDTVERHHGDFPELINAPSDAALDAAYKAHMKAWMYGPRRFMGASAVP